MSLLITPMAELVVRAPIRVSIGQVEQFISKQSAWISKTLHKVNLRPRPVIKQFVEGEIFLFLGNSHPLKIVDDALDPFFFEENTFYVRRSHLPKARLLFVKWYKVQAVQILTARVEAKAKSHGLTFQAIKISSARGRWGSCSWNGNLNFSWRLLMAPLPMIDYVVAHELAHLKHANHSRDFWSFVAELYSEYKQARRWFRHNGPVLTF